MINKVQIKVRGYHLDIFQHVNNARYLEFLEEGRWDFFEEFGVGLEMLGQGVALVVVNINIDFKKEASAGDVLEVCSSISKLGNRSITMQQKIVNHQTQETVAEAQVTYVCVSQKLKSAIDLPAEYRHKIEQAIVAVD